jgi:CheY-like chemotaxis protein
MPESRPRLLIVDDQEQNRYVLTRALVAKPWRRRKLSLS